MKLREVLFAALMLQHDFYPCCGVDHPPNEGRGEKCKTSGLFVAMQNTAAGRKQARPAVSRGSRNQHIPGTLLKLLADVWLTQFGRDKHSF